MKEWMICGVAKIASGRKASEGVRNALGKPLQCEAARHRTHDMAEASR